MSVENPGVKKLSARDLFLGIICLLLFLDTATSSAAMGPTSITWYLIMAAVFFIPIALVTAELGSSYPSDGGLYHWVKISLGDDWASRVSWYYWLNNAVWIASATIFVMDVLSQMLTLLTGIEISFFVYIAASVVLIWIYIFIAMRPLKESTVITNIGAIAKLAIVASLVICAVCYLIFNDGQTATNLSIGEFKPSLGAALVFFPALIYNLMGLDAICAIGGSNIENPGRDLPHMMITNVLLITIVYIIANLAILIITPTGEIDIINGILNCFLITFDGGIGTVLYLLVGILFLYTLLTQGPAWMQAAGYMALESAEHKELPRIFGTTSKKHGTPLGSLVLIAVVGTVLVVSYGLLAAFVGGSAEDLFWTLFSFTSIIFLIPFLACFSAFIKLRKTDKETVRPYRFPGPQWLAFGFSRLGQIILICTIVLFFWVPGESIDWITNITLGSGVLIGIVIGEVFNYRRKKAQRK